jgi:hypothetical protein
MAESYDKAKWHFEGDYPEDLPPENGGTHIGMFLAWTILNGLEGEPHRKESKRDLTRVRNRKMTGRDFLFRNCDGVLTEEDLNDEGNAFARSYFADPDRGGYGKYMADYAKALDTAALPSEYHVEDTWENYDKLAALIDRRYAAWRKKQTPKPPRK